MSEQPDLQPPDLRSDAERFEDAVRTILAAPKSKVDAQMAAAKSQRQKPKPEPPKK